MASSTSKYQTLVSQSGQAGSNNNNNDNINGQQFDDTSLQQYPLDHSNSDSFSPDNLSIDKMNNGDIDDPNYHSIESYTKNSIIVVNNNKHQNNKAPITTNNNKTTNDYTRSSSPIPVLLRSASSVLSRSMRLPPGSLRASTFTVITGMVGGGTFTFSYGIYKSGMIPGLIYLIIISSLAGYSTHAIVFCAERNNCPSFRTLAKKLYGNKTAMFIQICLVLLLWMACISYMTLTKNLLSQAVSQLLNDNDDTHWYDNDILLLLIASILPTWLALQRKVSALRYASLFGLLVVIFSMILVVITFFKWCHESDPQNTPSPTPFPTHNITSPTMPPSNNDNPGFDRECFINSISDNDYLFNSDLLGHTYTIALFFGGFAAQFTVLPIYFEMQKRSPRNMTKCITSGFGFTFIIYLVIAFFGYWTFPNLTDPKNDQNLITLYKNDTAMLIAQILLALYVMSIIPLFAHAFRKSLNELIHARMQKKNNKKKQKKKLINDQDDNSSSFSFSATNSDTNNDNDTDNDNVDDREIIEDAIDNPHLAYVPVSPEAKQIVEDNKKRREKKGTISKSESLELPLFYHALVTLLFLASVFGVAVFADNIGQVNSIIASTTLPICCFIFPCLCALKTDKASLRMKIITSFMAIFAMFNAIMFFYNMFANS